MKRLPQFFLFFCFFVSFAVINFPSAQWGLQMSWMIGIIMLIFFPVIIGTRFKFHCNHNFKLVSSLFFIIIGLSFASWCLQDLSVIVFKNDELEEFRSRSIFHCIYLLYEFILYLYLLVYLNESDKRQCIRWFIEYPFYVIALYGFYQWLSTFDIVPYTEIFNNNESTGFTYLRFKGVHRCCSVFPEPSEYAYYLGFMLPFIFAPYFNHTKTSICFFQLKKLSIILYLFSVLAAGSMSFFAVMPILFYIVSKQFIRLSKSALVTIVILFILALGAIVVLQGNRLSEMGAGNDGSSLTRFEAFVDAISMFQDSPIIGSGFGSIRGLDLLSFMLGTTGIIGTVSFIVIIYKLKNYSYINKIFKTALICMIIVALFSNPILDQTFFWPILAFVTTPLNTDNRKQDDFCKNHILSYKLNRNKLAQPWNQLNKQ